MGETNEWSSGVSTVQNLLTSNNSISLFLLVLIHLQPCCLAWQLKQWGISHLVDHCSTPHLLSPPSLQENQTTTLIPPLQLGLLHSQLPAQLVQLLLVVRGHLDGGPQV